LPAARTASPVSALTYGVILLALGVFAQAVLGQLTVEFDLKPGFVMAHFLVSIVLLTNAIWLYWRAGQPDGATETRRIVSARLAASSPDQRRAPAGGSRSAGAA